MPDWTKSMKQTFEYYEVDPETWGNVRRITNIVSSSIQRDMTQSTLGSASFECIGKVGEMYIRPYLVTIQNRELERFSLGTFLIQSTATSFDGMKTSISLDGYTPLIELKETYPPLGYGILKGENIMSNAIDIVKTNTRAPIVPSECSETLFDNFVADANNTWLDFVVDLMSNANYSFYLDELSRILFQKSKSTDAMTPIWTYSDDNGSILYPELQEEVDLYGIPNVVEVYYSSDDTYMCATVKNEDKNSKTSIQQRGRQIVYRETSPSLSGTPNQAQLNEYANNLLESLSTVSHTLTYKHGYCPVRIGDAVRLNFKSAGLTNVKARVTSQTINCTPGCTVEERAVYTEKLWEAS